MRLTEAELRASIRAVGLLVPVLSWRGATVDGRRREQICGEEGVHCPVVVLTTLEQTCAALWLVHPDRAVQVAREHRGGHAGLAPTVRELAELCGVSVSAVALQLAREKPRKQSNRSPRRTRSVKTEHLKFWCEPQLKHYGKLVGAKRGMDLSQTVRVALWEYIQKHLPRAPAEGTERAPSIEHVRPPKLPR